MSVTITDLERSQIIAELDAIRELHEGGRLEPRRAVEEVERTPEAYPSLHARLKWDNDDAAREYRVLQMGSIFRQVKISIVRVNARTRQVEVTPVRALQSRPSMRRAGGGYERVDDIFKDPSKRAELLAQVVRDLAAYRRRYAELSELQSVWAAVDEATIDLADGSSSQAPSDGASRPGAAG